MYWLRAALAGTRLVRRVSGSTGRFGGAPGASASGMGNHTSSSLGNTAAAPVNQIQETISNNCVVIFSKTSCSYCTMAKKLFHDMNVSYKVVELDLLEYGSQFQDALCTMTGDRTVPRIFVNGTFIGGAMDTHRLHQEGKLLPLVHQCYLKKTPHPSPDPTHLRLRSTVKLPSEEPTCRWAAQLRPRSFKVRGRRQSSLLHLRKMPVILRWRTIPSTRVQSFGGSLPRQRPAPRQCRHQVLHLLSHREAPTHLFGLEVICQEMLPNQPVLFYQMDDFQFVSGAFHFLHSLQVLE
uniref:Glutaredoxin-2, mitochondrial n=1 Tax=Sus scrofa TaxID=9823 RepID=A0A8D0R3P9_PIG